MLEEEKLYQKCLHFLSYRPRSEKEIRNFLKKKTSSLIKTKPILVKNLFDSIIFKLKNKNLINDRQFVSWWIEQRLTFRPKGKKLLRLELEQKGIDSEIINQAISLIDDSQLLILAKKLAIKKIKLELGISKQKQKGKLFSYLARRGFNFDLIKIVVDETLEK